MKVLKAPCMALEEIEKIECVIDIIKAQLTVCTDDEVPLLLDELKDYRCALQFTKEYFDILKDSDILVTVCSVQ